VRLEASASRRQADYPLLYRKGKDFELAAFLDQDVDDGSL
jgi:hypothetical protein